MEALRSRRTAADGGVVLCMLAFAVLCAFAPASRNIAPSTASTAGNIRAEPVPVVAGVAALTPIGRDAAADPSVVAIEREWDTEQDLPAIISWWDEERWTALEDQQVAAVSASRYAVGRVAKRVASAATSVLVDVRSTVMTGGVEGTSPSGV